MKNNILNLTSQSDKLFFGEAGHGISRYDTVKYNALYKLNTKMQNFFWRPNSKDMSQEKRSFDGMTKSEQHVFTANLKRQILLDSVQGRSPSLVFLPYCTDPTLENCIITWGFFESIHSESYTHIIRAIYPDPSVIFDTLHEIREIADCAVSVTAAYDQFISNPTKKNLYLALIAANALESLRFYVSFACTFSLFERGLVVGSAEIVKEIARDEIEHVALTQHILKLLPKDDPEFVDIIADSKDEALNIFSEAAQQEKDWISYLFKDGPILGLNEKILSDYIDYLFLKRTKAVGLSSDHSYKGNHPIPWIEKHFTNVNTQVAPQETEIVSYLSSASLNNNIAATDFDSLWKEEIDI